MFFWLWIWIGVMLVGCWVFVPGCYASVGRQPVGQLMIGTEGGGVVFRAIKYGWPIQEEANRYRGWYFHAGQEAPICDVPFKPFIDGDLGDLDRASGWGLEFDEGLLSNIEKAKIWIFLWRWKLPYWMVLPVFFLDPLLWTWRWLRKQVHRPRPGHCHNCGYDLRATPYRCPECGTAVPPPALPSGQQANR
jgi:hypothetical protein